MGDLSDAPSRIAGRQPIQAGWIREATVPRQDGIRPAQRESADETEHMWHEAAEARSSASAPRAPSLDPSSFTPHSPANGRLGGRRRCLPWEQATVPFA
ncbi:hypothetical protein CDD83_570 [Cordyceps sp. RAO-2017]|nr:hypothetical protein CDD83_570 [Cordyceps sp. RAO-2017]